MTVVLRTPPGPAERLALGDLRADPLTCLQELAATHGDIVRYGTRGLDATLLNSPRYVRHVLQDYASNYTKLGTPDLMMLRPMLGEALMTSEGSSWRRQRRMLQPAFTRANVERYAAAMTGMAADLVDGWAAQADVGRPVEACAQLSGLTLHIAAYALFGYDLGDRFAEFADAVQALNETMGHPDPSDHAMQARFVAGRATVRALVDDVIASQLARTRRDPDVELPLLMRPYLDATAGELDTSELRDQIVTFLLAGHETTAKSLAWIMYLLSEEPSWRERIRAELGDAPSLPRVADLPRLASLRAVVLEALRLYPPVWIISRMSIDDDEIDGYAIPAGTLACISPYVLHRSARLWNEPERFDPSRFMGVSGALQAPLMPFSAGPRHCIGRRFGQLELHLLVATLVQRCDLDLVPGHPVFPQALVTLRPAHGLPMTVRMRTASAQR